MKKRIIKLFIAIVAGFILFTSCGGSSGSIGITSVTADKVKDPKEGECMDITMEYAANGVKGEFGIVVYFQKDGEPIIDNVNDKYNVSNQKGTPVGMVGTFVISNNPEDGTLSLRFPFKELHVKKGTPNLSFVIAITQLTQNGIVNESDVIFQSDPIEISY